MVAPAVHPLILVQVALSELKKPQLGFDPKKKSSTNSQLEPVEFQAQGPALEQSVCVVKSLQPLPKNSPPKGSHNSSPELFVQVHSIPKD